MQRPPSRLMTLKQAAQTCDIPLSVLRKAVYGKWRKLEAVQVEVSPGLVLWHTWPEAVEAYKQVHTEAPWRKKQPK